MMEQSGVHDGQHACLTVLRYFESLWWSDRSTRFAVRISLQIEVGSPPRGLYAWMDLMRPLSVHYGCGGNSENLIGRETTRRGGQGNFTCEYPPVQFSVVGASCI